METASGTKSEFGGDPKLVVQPISDAEKKAVECYAAFQKVDGKRHEAGMAFGQAMIELHEELKHGDWLKRLDELKITRAQARYWMDKINKKKQTDRPETDSPQDNFGWDAALDRLKQLSDGIARLKRRDPIGHTLLSGEFEELAKILDYEIAKKGVSV